MNTYESSSSLVKEDQLQRKKTERKVALPLEFEHEERQKTDPLVWQKSPDHL